MTYHESIKGQFHRFLMEFQTDNSLKRFQNSDTLNNYRETAPNFGTPPHVCNYSIAVLKLKKVAKYKILFRSELCRPL